MATERERSDAVESHDWPDWAVNRRASGERVKVGRRDPVTLEAVLCRRCRTSAADAIDLALPCSSSFDPRGTLPVS